MTSGRADGPGPPSRQRRESNPQPSSAYYNQSGAPPHRQMLSSWQRTSLNINKRDRNAVPNDCLHSVAVQDGGAVTLSAPVYA